MSLVCRSLGSVAAQVSYQSAPPLALLLVPRCCVGTGAKSPAYGRRPWLQRTRLVETAPAPNHIAHVEFSVYVIGEIKVLRVLLSKHDFHTIAICAELSIKFGL